MQLQITARKNLERNEPLSPFRLVFLFVGAILFSVAGGAVAGLISAVLGAFFYTAFLFPLGMGFGGGGAIVAAVQLARVKNKISVVFLSMLAAVALYGAYLYGGYLVLQVQTSFEISSNQSEATSDRSLHNAKVMLDSSLYQKTGYPGPLGYVLYQAQKGVAWGRFYRSDRPHLSPALTWAYWILEFGIILWVIQFMGGIEANKNSIRGEVVQSINGAQA